MAELFQPDRTFRFRKYILASNTLLAACRGGRAPSRLVSVEQLLAEHAEGSRRVDVAPAQRLEALRFDYHGPDPAYGGGLLPEVTLPPTYVLAIENGRAFGREGTVHVPAIDASVAEFEWPPRDLSGFRNHLPGRAVHPRYWKQVVLREWRMRFLPALRRCPGRVALLNGFSPHNFFHWTTEILPRLQTLRQSGEQADWYLIDCHASYQRQALAALGVPLDRTIQPHATLHVEADVLLVPSIRPDQAVRATADALAAGLGVSETRAGTRVFIDRRHSRKVANADAFASWWRNNGFERHYLEDLSLQRQIELVKHADIVLGTHGAGLAHIVHCRPGTLVVELMPEGIARACYPRLSRLAGLRHVMLSMPRSGLHHDFAVSLDALDQAIATANRGATPVAR